MPFCFGNNRTFRYAQHFLTSDSSEINSVARVAAHQTYISTGTKYASESVNEGTLIVFMTVARQNTDCHFR